MALYSECKEKGVSQLRSKFNADSLTLARKLALRLASYKNFCIFLEVQNREQTTPNVRRDDPYCGTRYLCFCGDNGLAGCCSTTATE
jgi:hypothetical protein